MKRIVVFLCAALSALQFCGCSQRDSDAAEVHEMVECVRADVEAKSDAGDVSGTEWMMVVSEVLRDEEELIRTTSPLR